MKRTAFLVAVLILIILLQLVREQLNPHKKLAAIVLDLIKATRLGTASAIHSLSAAAKSSVTKSKMILSVQLPSDSAYSKQAKMLQTCFQGKSAQLLPSAN